MIQPTICNFELTLSVFVGGGGTVFSISMITLNVHELIERKKKVPFGKHRGGKRTWDDGSRRAVVLI